MILDELGEQLGLIEHRIAPVERLVGLAEALEVDGDDPVGLGELGRDVPPGIGARAEAVDEEHRRAFAFLLVVEFDRRVGRSEPRVGSVDAHRRALSAAGAERKRDERQGRASPSARLLTMRPLTLGSLVRRTEQRTPSAATTAGAPRISTKCIAATFVCRCTPLRGKRQSALVNQK